MLHGSTVLAAVHLVSEPATWLCLCIVAWQQKFGSVKKKPGKKSKSGGDVEGMPQESQPGGQLVREQLVQLQQAVAESLQAVVNALSARLKAPLKPQMAHATQAALGDGPRDLAQALAGCLSQAEIHQALNAVLVAQSLTLKRIKLQASELVSAL